jgi:hypothetical protein
MRKHPILAIFTFGATFLFSVIVMSAISPFISDVQPLPVDLVKTPTRDSQLVKERIRGLLERDRLHGQYLARDLKRAGAFSGRGVPLTEALERRATPTATLVSRMESNDETGLPSDVRHAWHAHKNAWRRYSLFLDRLSSRAKWQLDDDVLNETLDDQNDEINSTYQELLDVAREHGVDFED